MNSPLPLAAAIAALLAGSASAADRKVDFAKDVQPILKASCVKCHGLDAAKPKKKPASGYRLDDKAAAFKGGKSGRTAIVPGHAKDSALYQLLNGPIELEDGKDIDPMPHVKHGDKFKPLPADQIETVRLWIDQGADWPEPAK